MGNADVYATDGVAVTWAAAMNAGHGYRTKIALAIYIYIRKFPPHSFWTKRCVRFVQQRIHLADICIARMLTLFGLHLTWTWAAHFSLPSVGRSTIRSIIYWCMFGITSFSGWLLSSVRIYLVTDYQFIKHTSAFEVCLHWDINQCTVGITCWSNIPGDYWFLVHYSTTIS